MKVQPSLTYRNSSISNTDTLNKLTYSIHKIVTLKISEIPPKGISSTTVHGTVLFHHHLTITGTNTNKSNNKSSILSLSYMKVQPSLALCNVSILDITTSIELLYSIHQTLSLKISEMPQREFHPHLCTVH